MMRMSWEIVRSPGNLSTEFCEAGIYSGLPGEFPISETDVCIRADVLPVKAREVCEISESGGFAYLERWNGSFHDSEIKPCLVAWGSCLMAAKVWLKKGLAELNKFEKKDSASFRMAARMAVRKGD